MDYQEQLIRKIAKEHDIDFRIVKEVVYSPLKFTNRVIQHNTDMRPMRIMYFGVFMQKIKKNKANRMSGMIEVLLENIDEVTIVMGAILQFPVTSVAGAEKIINSARDTNDYDKIKMIWDAWQEYKK